MGRMLRNLVCIKDETEGVDMKRFVRWLLLLLRPSTDLIS